MRSDAACQWSMQAISVVTKRCGCYWACSVELPREGKVTSPGCATASAPSARSGLPGFCTRSSPGGGVGASEWAPGTGSRRFFFISCVVCLKILQHDLAACWLRRGMMPWKQATEATRCCQNTPTVAQLTSLRATYKIKACKRQRRRSDVVVPSDGNQIWCSKVLQCDASTHLSVLLQEAQPFNFTAAPFNLRINTNEKQKQEV